MFAGRRVPVGEGVDNFTSNLDMTLSGSKGTASSFKSCLDILEYKDLRKRGVERNKKLGLGDMVNERLYEPFDLMTVRAL